MSNDTDFDLSGLDPEILAALQQLAVEEVVYEEHIQKYVGKIEQVFSIQEEKDDTSEDDLMLDIYWIAPTSANPFHTLITKGLSDYDMIVPEEAEGLENAELLVHLPPTWQISSSDWILDVLKLLAEYPIKLDTYISYGHSLPNGSALHGSTKMDALVVLDSLQLDEDFSTLFISDTKIIHFYTVVPLYTEELDYKIKYGIRALLDKFGKYKINDIWDLQRKNVVTG